MPTSGEATVAYIPRNIVLLQQNTVRKSPRSVKDIKVDIHQLVDAPSKVALSTSKAKLITATAIGAGVITMIAVATTLGLVLSANNTITTTTTTTTTTETDTTTTTTTAMAAPANLVGYRGNINQTYTFALTGSNSGGIWGTTIYTDDSNVATAAVHAGFVALNQISVVTIMILTGQNSYTSTTQNGITSNSWGSWPGSYCFISATG